MTPERDEIAFFNVALIAWHERGDLAPLLDYVRSDRPMTPRIREVIAALMENLHARTRPRPNPGKPGGTHARWREPIYLAAWLTESKMRHWRETNDKKRVPKVVSYEFIAEAISDVNKWHIMRGEKPLDPTINSNDHERVVTLVLREPKSKRL
jgi:hypothetical protein